MNHHHIHRLTRRDFLKLSGVALGAAGLACGGGSRLVELTAVPSSNSPTIPVPTLAAGEFADTIVVNGNIVTIDARRSTAQALAIKNGLILYVGDDQTARNMAGASTQVIDIIVIYIKEIRPPIRPCLSGIYGTIKPPCPGEFQAVIGWECGY